MLPEAASVLAKLQMNCAIAKAWWDRCRRELRPVAKNNTITQWREEEELEGIRPLSLQGVVYRRKSKRVCVCVSKS